MRYLLAPGTFDCNRGDQALLWQAMDALRKADPRAELAVMSDVFDSPDDPQVRQTAKLDISILPSLLPNPRRSASRGKYEVIDSGWSVTKMRARAVLDFLQTLVLWLCPRRAVLARVLLGKERYRTYCFLRRCRALVVKGGGFLYAHRGLRWAYYVWYALFPLLLAERCGVGVIVLPNSFGPFESRWPRWLARRVLRRCEILTARSPMSRQELDALVPGRSLSFPDMAFLLAPAGPDWARAELARLGVHPDRQPCVGISMRPHRFPNSPDPQESYRRYVRAFAGLIRHLLGRGLRPVLFAQVTGPHANEDDRVALRDALQATPAPDQVVLVDGDYDCGQFKAMYGLMEYMVCTRFHSAIFSIAQGVPCLAVSYATHKAEGIMAEMGLGELVLPIDGIDTESLVAAFEELAARADLVKEKMVTYVADCRRRLAELDELLARQLGFGGGEGPA